MRNNLKNIVKITPLCVLLLCVESYATATQKKVESVQKADIKKESYSIGASTGQHVVNQIVRQKEIGIETDIDEVIKGFKDAFKGKIVLSDDEIITHLNNRADRLNILTLKELQKLKKENLEKGKKYLAKNKTKKGVIETKSGLQYEVIKKGSGKEVQPESIVVVNYIAKLIDGTIFDDTYKRKAPAHLSMINLIDGMAEGLMLMKEGAKYRFTIPSELAYKEDGVADVPPNSVIVFEMELSKVLKPGEFKNMAHQKANVKIDAQKPHLNGSEKKDQKVQK